MTIEFSLRRRATRARLLGALWLTCAVLIMIGSFLCLPMVLGDTLAALDGNLQETGNVRQTASDASSLYSAVSIVMAGLLAVIYSCYLLGRSASAEMQYAWRSNALADALCIAGEKLDDFEKTANLLTSLTRLPGIVDDLSKKDRAAILELVKLLKPGG